ncbi:MAG: T9SS C-terminal target domain-containing protein [Chlorobi bacterium]|nr:MAG: T9SS type A sorting domain-containing protein [Bacteroidota bacterium]MBE2265236.1 T9SS type A sorting domain-containing protein [Flavobacteriales bacterium]MBL1160301.1 T9SS C-terminal target domain-containing protein [Chlorobiota bacterium]MBW7853440.1 T9SS type A sorting domain-containing protein [Candidatus Kapabacteria bacterium]MCC6330486.1 T9SS type A sorting domain-containing protein [Ignavibacteria bacterium]
MKTTPLLLLSVLLLFYSIRTLPVKAQPLVNPYTFTMGPDVALDSSLVAGPWDTTFSRIVLNNGHFAYEDGRPFRMVGVTIAYGACFPDSSNAIAIARRLRALGINIVRFTGFDYTPWWPISIFPDGTTTTGKGLDAGQMAKFDWFVYNLRKHGIRYGFSFQNAWVPRKDDGVRQPDSAGVGARLTVLFDPLIQRIHRDVIRLLLSHVNSFTNIAYKDDPMLAFVMPLENSPISLYWLYTREIVASNPVGQPRTIGLEHHALIDSLYFGFLKGKGLKTDKALNDAWSVTPTQTQNLFRNGDFEDAFDQTWTLGVSAENGTQALMQFITSDKAQGQQCAQIRIGNLGTNPRFNNIYVMQSVGKMERLGRYTLSFFAKTTPEKGSRSIILYLVSDGVPYNSYGVVDSVRISSQWARYEISFFASSLPEAAGRFVMYMGHESGDVYLDDLQLKQVGVDGLQRGESIERKTLPRDLLSNRNISPARMKANADFYRLYLTNILDRDYKLIRDTLKCKALLTPSSRLYSRLDQEAAMQYDFFCWPESRSQKNDYVADNSTWDFMMHSQNKFEGKAVVVTDASVRYPLPYAHELTIFYPVYSGVQNWDGMIFSTFMSTATAGNSTVEKNSEWTLGDKPSLLTQIPAMSALMRRFDVDSTRKVISISQSREALDYPPFHITQPYSLSIYTDGRMLLFRRTETRQEFQEEESLLPHREVSALAGQIDPTRFDAENDQVFLDGTKGILRVFTPNYWCVAGKLDGQLVIEKNMIVEQLSKGVHTSVVISSLTADPITESNSSLLVIGSRGANEGAEWNAENEMISLGDGPYQMEGRTIRLVLTMPGRDSCRIVPLGADGREMTGSWTIAASAGGKFNVSINTTEHKTPWYRIENPDKPVGIGEDTVVQSVVYPNPASHAVTVRGSGDLDVSIFNIIGEEVARGSGNGLVTIPVERLPSGRYVVQTLGESRGLTPIAIVR